MTSNLSDFPSKHVKARYRYFQSCSCFFRIQKKYLSDQLIPRIINSLDNDQQVFSLFYLSIFYCFIDFFFIFNPGNPSSGQVKYFILTYASSLMQNSKSLMQKSKLTFTRFENVLFGLTKGISISIQKRHVLRIKNFKIHISDPINCVGWRDPGLVKQWNSGFVPNHAL